MVQGHEEGFADYRWIVFGQSRSRRVGLHPALRITKREARNLLRVLAETAVSEVKYARGMRPPRFGPEPCRCAAQIRSHFRAEPHAAHRAEVIALDEERPTMRCCLPKDVRLRL
jgi:hypothetical protein